MIVLADGAGGTGSGALAAAAFLDHVRAAVALCAHVDTELDPLQVVSAADAHVAAAAPGGETTGVIVVVTAALGVIGASVGDSEAWLVRDADTMVLTRHQQRKPLLGSRSATAVPFAAPRLDGTLIVASDGLCKYTTEARIRDVVRGGGDLQTAPARLVDLVRLRSGALQDDVAVTVCRR